ncbi:MAG: uroporphyrinogen-III synthase [Bacteroidota bacterium]
MTTSPHKVLCLKVLNAHQRGLAQRLGLDVLEASALGVEYLDPAEIEGLDTLPTDRARWVFTSRKAVKAVADLLRGDDLAKPSQVEFYGVGAKTAEAIQDLLQADAQYPPESTGSALGRMLAEDTNEDSPPIIYWRGNRSTGQLQDILAEHQISLTQIQVYRTDIQELDLPEEDFRAVIFVSPSSVEAFRNSGGFEGERRHWFAIGPTTAAAVRDYIPEEEHVHLPDEISMEEVLYKVADVLGSEPGGA